MVGSRVTEVTKCYHPEVVSPALDEESVREVEEVIVPDRDSAGFIRGEGGVAVSSLKFKGSDFKEGTFPEPGEAGACAGLDGFSEGGRVSAEGLSAKGPCHMPPS